MRRELRLSEAGGDTERLVVESESDRAGTIRIRLRGDGERFEARRTPGGWILRRGRETQEAAVRPGPDRGLVVELGGHRFRCEAARGRLRRGRGDGEGGGAQDVRSPMPGKVVRILRNAGDRVEVGEAVLVFEAMKMQNEIRAPAAGVIANMMVATGELAEAGAPLFRLEPV